MKRRDFVKFLTAAGVSSPFLIPSSCLGNEEKLLCRELDGYRAYKKKVRYRLIPYIF